MNRFWGRSIKEVVIGVADGVNVRNFLIEKVAKGINVYSLGGGDEDGFFGVFGVVRIIGILRVLRGFQSVNLVTDHDDRLFVGVDVGEGLIDGIDLRLVVGMRDVDNMKQEVGFNNLVEGRLEAFNKLRGELADEAYSIREEEGKVADDHLADGGVEGGEEFVFRQHIALGQEVEDSGLTHIGIAHKCHADKTLSVLSLESFLSVKLGELDFKSGNLLLDKAAVGLYLSLARTTHANTTALAFEVGPHSCQPRQHIL